MVNTLVTPLSHAAAPFIVQVAERPAIATIDFAGMHEFDKDNLTKALKNAGDQYQKFQFPIGVSFW
jgi:outer membrane protein assembly factor BamA